MIHKVVHIEGRMTLRTPYISTVLTEEHIHDVLELMRRMGRMCTRISTRHANVVAFAAIEAVPIARVHEWLGGFSFVSIALQEDETLAESAWRFFDAAGKLAVEIAL